MGYIYLKFKTVMPHFPLKVIITFLHTYKLCIRVIYSPYPDQQFKSKTLKFFFLFFLQFNGCKIAFHYNLNLLFPDYWWSWTSCHIYHLCFLFCEKPVYIFCPFYSLVGFFPYIFMGVLYVLKMLIVLVISCCVT